LIEVIGDNGQDISLLFASNLINDLSITRDIEIIFCDNKQMKKYNFIHRNKNKPTDIISLPIELIYNEPLGSLIISLDYIKQSSIRFNHSKQDEFNLLFIHGLLHLIGYDHESDNGEMREKEKEIIQKYNLPSSLIIRNSNG